MRELERRIHAFVTQQPQSTTTKRYIYRSLARHYQNSEQFNKTFDAMVRAGSIYTRQAPRGRMCVSSEPFE
jgi:O-acetylhomoserine/O-acetylserine sulfhydrylase-like pyridoxal-dependent enzyme